MSFRVQRVLPSLDLEERILAGASLIAFISVFLPWISGEWLSDDTVSHSGFEFFTSYLGTAVALLHIAILLLTVVPAGGGSVRMKRKTREYMRLALAGQSSILTFAALSVLVNVTYDYTRMDIRFGIYLSFAGCVLSTFYAFWKLQEFRKNEPKESFHHPETPSVVEDVRENFEAPPPPPPPPPLNPEDYRMRP